MPAIQPARLKIQAAELSEFAQSPEDFCRAYHKFLEFYTDRIHRSGFLAESPPLIRSYQIPHPVFRAVSLELDQFAEGNRASALELADALWSQPYLEFRLLAADLVGKVDPLPASSIVARINKWVTPSTEEPLVNALIFSGFKRLREEQVTEYFQQIDTWLKSRQVTTYSLGLKAVTPLIAAGSFEDIPLVFHRVNQAMRSAPKILKPEVLELLKLLADRYPQETAYFLRQAFLSAGENPNIPWYVRHSLAYFPSENREYLRSTLQSEDPSSTAR